MLHARALCNRACELLEWAAQEALDVRLLRHPLVCSWRSLSTCNTTKGRCALSSLYIEERAARARALGCHCSWFLSRFASIETCFVSAGVLLSSLAIDSTLVFLIPASVTPLARRVPFYIANIYIYNMYEHFNQLILIYYLTSFLASFLACLLIWTLVIG